jgi:opine dehydrogenase
MGLCLLESLAAKANIKTPVASALISIASALLKSNYREQGRTLENLNLSNMDIKQIKALISQ